MKWYPQPDNLITKPNPPGAACLCSGVVVSVSQGTNSRTSKSICQFCQWYAASYRATKCPEYPPMPDTFELSKHQPIASSGHRLRTGHHKPGSIHQCGFALVSLKFSELSRA
jgi:hypothetical protein